MSSRPVGRRRPDHVRGGGAVALAALLLVGCTGESAVSVSGDPAGGEMDGGSGDGGEGDAGAGPEIPVDAGSPDDGGEGVVPDGGEDVAALPPGSRAGAYVGRFGDGEGVFVLDRAERLIGLVRGADGAATSWFAEFADGTASGPASRFAHAAADGTDGSPPSPLGTRSGEGPELGLVAGERIDGIDADAGVALEASGRDELAPVTRASLAGRWEGAHRDCDSLGEHCTDLTFALDVEGLGLSGSSGVLTSDGTDLFPVPVSGELVPLGHFAEVVFEWNTYDYAGVVHFLPGESDRLLLIGHTDRELADHPVVAAILTRDGDG